MRALTALAACASACASRAPVGPKPRAPSMTLDLVAFGGDPTCVNDSSTALAAAVAAALAVSWENSLPGVIGSGGVAVDLGGGTYLVSEPLVIADGAGVTLRGGTLRAAPSFPPAACMVNITGGQHLAIADLTLDAAHTGACLCLDNVLQLTVADSFFLHYKTFGILGDDAHGASHELLVTGCFFAEFMWGEPGFNNVAAQTGTALFLASQFYDSNFYDSIIRCTRVGVVNMAGANLFHGVHIYSTCNKDPSGGNVSVGFINAAWGQTRVSNCYFDDSPLVILHPSEITLKDNLFYGLSGLVVAPTAHNMSAQGVLVAGNVFTQTPYSGGGPTLHYDTSNGTVDAAALLDCVVADNSVAVRAAERTTRVTATLLASGEGGSVTWSGSIDLRSQLLFLSASPPPWNWRASAAPALAHIAAREPIPSGAGAAARRTARPADAFGGALSQLQATASLVSASTAAAGAGSLASSGLGVTASVFPTAVAGVLDVVVELVTLAAGSATPAAVSAWSAFVTVSVDQSLPDGVV
jgi:hypothetical protein